jgi:hypothetical protein
MLNVALPGIQRDLHFSQQDLQWVLSGYTVAYGGFLLLGGRLADLPGRRVTLVIGTAVFADQSAADSGRDHGGRSLRHRAQRSRRSAGRPGRRRRPGSPAVMATLVDGWMTSW